MVTCIRNAIHISTKERNTSDYVWLDREFEPGTLDSLVRCSVTKLSGQLIYILGLSRPNYHIPTLTKFLPF